MSQQEKTAIQSSLPGFLNPTKLYRPRLTWDLVSRPRLFKILDHGLSQPLILVSAPAGYGKSTLVNAWLEENRLPAAWYSLDKHDNDVFRFAAYFCKAINELFPERMGEVTDLLDAPEKPTLNHLLGVMLRELRLLNQPCILVLDDFHCLVNKEIHSFFMDLLGSHAPTDFHLVLISRHDPPFPLTKLRARNLLTEVRVADLTFTKEEVTGFFQNAKDWSPNQVHVKTLLEKTEGWITGIRLFATTLRNPEELDDKLKTLKLNSRFIAEYLIGEILEDLENDQREFFLKTAISDNFCAGLADALLQPREDDFSHSLIKWIDHVNPFVFSLDDEGKWYRYHHLFLDVLRNQLSKKYTPEEIDALRYRAGVWFEQNGYPEESLQYYLAGGYLEDAVRVFDQVRQQMMNHAQWQWVERLFNLFPEEVRQENGILQLTKAWLNVYYGRVYEMYSMLEILEEKLQALPVSQVQRKNLLAELDALFAYRAYNTFKFNETIQASERCLERLSSENQYPYGIAWIFLIGALQATGKSREAVKMVYKNLDTTLNPIIKTHLLLVLNYVHWMEGDIDSLLLSGRKLAQFGEELGIKEAVVNGRHFIGIGLYQRNRLAEAEPYLRDAHRDRFQTIGAIHIFNAIALAYTLLGLRQAGSSQEVIDEMSDFALEKGIPVLLWYAQGTQAEVEWRTQRFAAAFDWVDRMETPPIHSASNFSHIDFILIKLLIYQGSREGLQRAAQLIERQKVLLQQLHNKRFLAEIHALEAMLKYTLGQTTAATASLKAALQLAQPGGLVRVFVDLGQKMAELLQAYQVSPLEAPFVKKLLGAFQPTAAKEEDVPLTNRELQVLKLMARHYTNKEIGNELFISERTVKKHIQHIFAKLQVDARTSAVKVARSFGILSQEVD